ncbi:hypothetical protein [Actinoplanes sp. NPDC051851]|uniref:hypothetical protein n=1 Tax=Actinoplanes sp. NPDC051851 TaxID=3154753 RepID=UPI00342BA752
MGERPQPDLGAVLRSEAERHLPDGDAMFARINRRRAVAPPGRRMTFGGLFGASPGGVLPGFTVLRPVMAAASVVATLVVGFTGIKLVTDRPDRAPAANEGSASVAPSASAPASAEPTPESTTKKPHRGGGTTGRQGGETTGTTGAPTSPTPSLQPTAGFLGSSGVLNEYSTDDWAQGDVTLNTTQAITVLEVAVRVVRTEGVVSTGSWSSIPAEMITIGVTEEKGTLLYRFTLKPGSTLAPGSYTFAVQYQHSGAHDVTADVYGAAASAGEEKAEVTGAFLAS